MAIVKGEMRSLQASRVRCECAGSLYLKTNYVDPPYRANDEVLPLVELDRQYRGTLIVKEFRFNCGESVAIATDNGFIGIVRITRIQVIDEGRSFSVQVESSGRPERVPAE